MNLPSSCAEPPRDAFNCNIFPPQCNGLLAASVPVADADVDVDVVVLFATVAWTTWPSVLKTMLTSAFSGEYE